MLSDDLRILTYLAGNTAAGNLSGTAGRPSLPPPLAGAHMHACAVCAVCAVCVVLRSCGEGLVLPGPGQARGGDGRHPPDARLCRRTQDVPTPSRAA
jgi:hypothetical protein